MFGAHLSIAGGLVNALDKAAELKLDCVQVFTKNQRQWKASPLKDEDRNAWLDRLNSLDWNGSGPPRVVSHNSYLINLATADPTVRKKSIALQRIEMERCEALKIPLLVMHPGAHLQEPRQPGDPNDLQRQPTKAERAGLDRIVKALDQLHRDLRGLDVITCLETTVGSGTNLGYSFQQLAYIREHVKQPDRVGYCFDTCHVTAAGYDMTTCANAEAVLQQFDAICGCEHIRVFHFNDSIGDVGSRRDRHTHIGDGACGKVCFETIIADDRFEDVPKIIETPKGETEKGTNLDTINIRRLRRMAKNTSRARE